MRPALMVYAAGFGTRMRPLTDALAKPMIPVAGRPLIAHAHALAMDAGLPHVVANTHYRADTLRPYLTAHGIAESFEPALLDTGGGLKAALPMLGGDRVATLNTDAVWTGQNPLRALIRAWRPGMGALLSVVPLDRATAHRGFGDFAMDAAGRLSWGGDLVYTGAQIIDTGPVAADKRTIFGLADIWRDLAGRGLLYGLCHDGGWADVGYPAAIPLAERMLLDVRPR